MNKMTNNKKPKHDALFRKIMENKIIAQKFLEYYLPADFKTLIDLSKLKVEQESYVDATLKRNVSDIVYSVQTKDDDTAICLCTNRRTIYFRSLYSAKTLEIYAIITRAS